MVNKARLDSREPKGRLLHWLTALLVLLSGAVVAPSTAQAQDPNAPRIDLDRFDPPPQIGTFTRMRDGEFRDDVIFTFLGLVSYGLSPFQLERSGAQQSVLDHHIGIDLGLVVAPTTWLQIGANIPVLNVTLWNQNADPLLAAYNGARGPVAFGDLELDFGLQPLRQDTHGIGMQFAPRFVFPTGGRRRLMGSGAWGLGMDWSIGRRWRHFRFAVNVGFQVNTNGRTVLNLRPDDELRFGVGLGVPFANDQVEIVAEWTLGTVIDPVISNELNIGPFHPQHTPSELTFGAVINPKNGPVTIRFGAGPGLTEGFGTPTVRAYFGLTANARRRRDSDGDGCYDNVDPCPNEPEDFDGFEDDDCCPDPDNDGDGILDIHDGPDNDGDGYGDCRDDAEDMDGFEDDDGCPDPDNDGDGIRDRRDGPDADGDGFGDCRDQPETVNGYQDDDGCPDEVPEPDCEFDTVYFEFDSSTLTNAARSILDENAQCIAERGLGRIRVEGHADERGSTEYNLALGQRRAEAVKEYLMSLGVNATIVTVSYGEEDPADPGSNEEAWSRNRRGEFQPVQEGELAPGR